MTTEEEDKTTLQPVIQPGHHGSDTDETRFETPSSIPATALQVQTNSAGIQSPQSNLDVRTSSHPIPDSTEQVHAAIKVGDVLKNRFQIIENLGQGGMGMVFKAQDIRKMEAKSHNPYVAIKVLNPALAQNQLLVAGLQRECEKAQELSHPNIITVYDFDRDSDLVYMSMEYLAGQSLTQLIRETGGMSLQRAWPLILEMATALAYAHQRGIVHSDFKPANVIVTHDHKVKVLDFGIAARTSNDQDSDATIFNARAEGGHTPTYASFEMMNGAKADPRDDIYAFGLVVYELLTGKHPYNRKSASEVFIEQQRSNKTAPAPVKGLSRRQWQALKSAIEILQDKRPKNLNGWLEQFDPKASRWSAQLLGGAVAIVLLGVSFAVNHWLSKPNEPTTLSASQPVVSSDASTQPELKLPIADAGNDQIGQLGVAVLLNGSASQSGDGEALQYGWRLAKTPAGSSAVLQTPNAVNPQFIPDKAGEYEVELAVKDQHNTSALTNVRIRVAEKAEEPVLHQATSADGLLSLAASKAQYRIGEQLKLNIQIHKSGYLRVAYISASGEVSELLPNQFQPSKVKSDTEYSIPPKGKFKLQITGPVGVDKIVAILSESPLSNLEKIVNSTGDIEQKYIQNNLIVAIQYRVVQ